MNHSLFSRIVLAGILVLTVQIYLPALHSGFFMDDYPNLHQLPEIANNGYLYYIFSGVSSSLGRPLSLLSFALQYPYWPTHPVAFKTVNLVLHLINGVLIFIISQRLAGRLQFSPRETAFFICSISALWLLHPIQISTTMYVVQRMTQLSALFTLAGVLFYLRYRPDPGGFASFGSMIAAGVGLSLFLTLAVLSKENGILLPLYLLIIEATLWREKRYSRQWLVWALVFLCLPLLLLAFYLGMHMDEILRGYIFRSYSVQDRLLTQAVVLLDYLYKILLPYPGAFSLFYDDFPISTGLFSPRATFVSICGIGLLLAVGVKIIRLYPVVSFGIFWFFGGHLLESSFLNLELYFEHRNYLPALGVIVPLTWGVVVAMRQAQYKKPVVIIACAWLLLVSFSTVSETRLWADPVRQAREWITRHPESPRAMNNLANIYLKSGNVATTLMIFKKISSLYPGEVYPALRVIALRGCALDQQTGDREWASLTKNAATATRDSFNSNVSEINAIVSAYGDNDCPGIDDGKLLKLLMALADNPHFGHMKVHLYDQAALLSLYKGDIYNAVRYVQQAINLSPSVPRQIFRAKLQLALGDIKAVGDTCSWIEQRFVSNLRDRLAYKRDFDELKQKIDEASKGDKRQD